MSDSIVLALVSLGCDKNLADSERLLSNFRAAGYRLTDERAEADVIIVNTCGFIQAASDESAEMVRQCAEYKETGRCRLVLAAGCMAKRYENRLAEHLPWADGALLFTGYADAPRAIAARLGLSVTQGADAARGVSTGHFAFLKIAEGCDNRCAYCTIPSIRGGYVSRAKEDLLAEARALKGGGVKELVVVAQDTSRYGLDLYGEAVLPALLSDLADVGFEAVRLMYCYPHGVTDELIAVMAARDNICKYIDLPIQHADDAVLSRMGRVGKAATAAGIRDVVDRLRRAMPTITIRTTVMVGFPGETEAEYRALERFVEEVKFERLGVFAYSREEGTAAYGMADQVPDNVKTRRAARIMRAQAKISRRKNKALAGRVMAARIDEVVSSGGDKDARYYARGETDAPDVDGHIALYQNGRATYAVGDTVRVQIRAADEYDLMGVLVE